MVIFLKTWNEMHGKIELEVDAIEIKSVREVYGPLLCTIHGDVLNNTKEFQCSYSIYLKIKQTNQFKTCY